MEEFLTISLSQRIRVVLERRVHFYLDDREVDRHVALDSLRNARVAG